jgi:hypothetical protein
LSGPVEKASQFPLPGQKSTPGYFNGCAENVFVPEGQADGSQARSAWESIPRENRPVGYGMIGRSIPDIPEVFLGEDMRRVS